MNLLYASGPLFTKRWDFLPQDHLGSTAADVPVKFQGDWQSRNPNLAASRLHEILRLDARLLSE